MLGKLSIIGAVGAIIMIPTAPFAQMGALLIPALPFVVPPSEVPWPGFGDLALAE